MQMIYKVLIDGQERIIKKQIPTYNREADNRAREEIIKHYLDKEDASEVLITEAYEDAAYQYWEEMYGRQIDEIPRNECERRLLIELHEGRSPIEGIHVLQSEFGISIQEGTAIYEEIRNRCNEWEMKNML